MDRVWIMHRYSIDKATLDLFRIILNKIIAQINKCYTPALRIDISGKHIKQFEDDFNAEEIFDISILNTGIYVVNALNNNIQATVFNQQTNQTLIYNCYRKKATRFERHFLFQSQMHNANTMLLF